MGIKEKLEKAGIDPFGGDCMCVAGAIQKIVDPRTTQSEVLCIKKDPYGRIGHCMFHLYGDEYHYDADGEHDWEESMGKFDDYTEDCYGQLEEDSCWETMSYDDEFSMRKYCGDKIDKVENIILNNPPEWLNKLKIG